MKSQAVGVVVKCGDLLSRQESAVVDRTWMPTVRVDGTEVACVPLAMERYRAQKVADRMAAELNSK